MSAAQDFLFIGGIRDGLVLSLPPDVALSHHVVEDFAEGGLRRTTYKRSELGGLVFYRAEWMSLDDCLQQFVKSYQFKVSSLKLCEGWIEKASEDEATWLRESVQPDGSVKPLNTLATRSRPLAQAICELPVRLERVR